MTQILRNWHKKNQIGKSEGERKKNPSANPVKLCINISVSAILYISYEKFRVSEHF